MSVNVLLKDFVEESIQTGYISFSDMVQVQTQDGEDLAFKDAETLAESDSEVANMVYIEDSKLDDGTLLVIVA